MALISNFASAGAGIVTAASKSTRYYWTDESKIFALTNGGAQTNWGLRQWYSETKELETREWVGLTYACAEAQRAANAQPAQVTAEDRIYTYDVQETLREARAYKLIRRYERTLNYKYRDSFLDRVTYNKDSGAYSYPFSLTVNSRTPTDGTYAPTWFVYRTVWSAMASAYQAFPTTITISAPCQVELIGLKYTYDADGNVLPYYGPSVILTYT